MKIIFLNCWYGKVEKPFFDFIKNEASETDIFCFAEVQPELFVKLSAILKDFKGFHKEGLFDKTTQFSYGQAVYIRKEISVKSLTDLEIYKNSSRNLGWATLVELDLNGKNLNIVNVHGQTRPGDKTDTPVRLKQSKRIIDFLKDKKGPKIIGGDFNLDLNTKSVSMFEEAGYRNLIKDFDIKNTRNELSWKLFNNYQYFADFAFVSPDVKVKNFKVPYLEISDHLPLILDFEV